MRGAAAAAALAIALLSIAARADPLVDSIVAARAHVRSMRASFDQETHVAAFDDTLRSTGVLVWAAPGRVRWEVAPPDDVTLVLDGSTVTLRVGNNPVERTPGGPVAAIVRAIVAMTSGSLAEAAALFDLSARAEGDRVVLLARPRGPDLGRLLDRIEAVFAADRRIVVEVRLFRPGGDRTTIRFRDVRLDDPVDPATFVLR